MDETAFWAGENSASPDLETYRAIRPGMATIPESQLIMVSSPHRRSGLLYSKWSKHFGKDDDNVLVIMAPTPKLNPTLDERVIIDALDDDPEAAKAEWLGHWRDDLASYIERQVIEACIDRGITMRRPVPGMMYKAFIDASSGAGKDSMCAAVGHREGDACVIDTLLEIRPPFSPPDAVATIGATIKAFGITSACADRWGLNFVATEFQRHGVDLEYSDKSSSEIFRQALPIIRSGRARLVDNERMLSQFCNLERRVLAGGNERIGHPERGNHHDDVAVVVAGCLVALSMASSADNWIEYYRRLNERAQMMPAERKDPHGHGWAFGSPPEAAPPAPIGEQVAALNPTDRQLLDIFQAAPRRNLY
jgi:hypothetical protein